jgi:hypothetical protein
MLMIWMMNIFKVKHICNGEKNWKVWFFGIIVTYLKYNYFKH